MIASTAEIYVHAIAIEREAAERYAHFAGRMAEQGNHAVAALFRMLATQETRHLEELQRVTAQIHLPALDADHSWPGDEAPETPPRGSIAPGMTQRQALAIALQAENSARAFFEQAARVAPDAATRALAEEMAAEEAHHAVLIERMLSQPVKEL